MNTASKDKSVLLQRIKSRLLQIATKDGDFMTAFPGLSIHRRSSVTDSIPCIYDLGLAITISGRKQVIAGKDVYEYQAGEALLASVDMPVMSRVLQASNSDPFFGNNVALRHTFGASSCSGACYSTSIKTNISDSFNERNS